MTTHKKSLLGLLIFLSITAFVTFAAITGVYIQKIGPLYSAANNFDSTTIGGIGGSIKTYTVATNDTLRIGQVAFISSKNTVKHSATATDYNAVAGVVVGGVASGSGQGSIAVADTSTIAATSGQQVYVMDRGRFWVLIDTGPGIAPGITVQPSVKSGMAGRVFARTTAIDTFNRIFATLIDTGLAGKAALAEVKIK